MRAIAVNPVDYKVRANFPVKEGQHRVLGWDAAGEVVAVGEEVEGFKPGDAVYYAGELNRQGCNAEYQLVDERLAAAKPKSLSDSEACALPLTAITAWELLFDRLGIARRDSAGKAETPTECILVIGAAGGVGSILMQLAKALSNATLIATASRPASQEWVKKMGADYVIDHSQPLLPQLESLGCTPQAREVSFLGAFPLVPMLESKGCPPPTHIASLNNTQAHFSIYPDLLVPFGKIAMIDDPASLDIMKLKSKSQSLHIEFMFTRSLFRTPDMHKQGQLLAAIAALVDDGLIKSTAAKSLGPISAASLRTAHQELESGHATGKIVLEGY